MSSKGDITGGSDPYAFLNMIENVDFRLGNEKGPMNTGTILANMYTGVQTKGAKIADVKEQTIHNLTQYPKISKKDAEYIVNRSYLGDVTRTRQNQDAMKAIGQLSPEGTEKLFQRAYLIAHECSPVPLDNLIKKAAAIANKQNARQALSHLQGTLMNLSAEYGAAGDIETCNKLVDISRTLLLNFAHTAIEEMGSAMKASCKTTNQEKRLLFNAMVDEVVAAQKKHISERAGEERYHPAVFSEAITGMDGAMSMIVSGASRHNIQLDENFEKNRDAIVGFWKKESSQLGIIGEMAAGIEELTNPENLRRALDDVGGVEGVTDALSTGVIDTVKDISAAAVSLASSIKSLFSKKEQ